MIKSYGCALANPTMHPSYPNNVVPTKNPIGYWVNTVIPHLCIQVVLMVQGHSIHAVIHRVYVLGVLF